MKIAEKTKTNHVILKKKNTLLNTWCEAGEVKERKIEKVYFEQISKLNGSEPDLTRRNVLEIAEEKVNLMFFSLIMCTIVRVSEKAAGHCGV